MSVNHLSLEVSNSSPVDSAYLKYLRHSQNPLLENIPKERRTAEICAEAIKANFEDNLFIVAQEPASKIARVIVILERTWPGYPIEIFDELFNEIFPE